MTDFVFINYNNCNYYNTTNVLLFIINNILNVLWFIFPEFPSPSASDSSAGRRKTQNSSVSWGLWPEWTKIPEFAEFQGGEEGTRTDPGVSISWDGKEKQENPNYPRKNPLCWVPHPGEEIPGLESEPNPLF